MIKQFKIIANNILLSFFLFSMAMPSQALNIVYGESILCKNRNLKTYLAFSTKEYNIVVCFSGNDCVYETEGNKYFYIGQDKRNNEQTFLSANHQVLDDMQWTEKFEAFNNNFKYEVYQTKKQGGYSSISISINEKQIYTGKAIKYIYNCYD